MKNISIVFIIVVCGFASCDKDEDGIPVTSVNNIHTFVYDREYIVRDINCYAGPEGRKENITEEELYANYHVWNPQDPSIDSLILNLDIDSAFSISGHLCIDYKISHRNDSIFGFYTGNGEEYFIGKLNEDKSAFTLYEHYYLWASMPRPEKGLYGAYTFVKGSKYGKMGYADNFFENNFASPSELTIEGDLVLWTNYEYSFRKEE